MQQACPGCGATNSEGSRFCSSCGQPLDTVPPRRKLVTALFCDIVGSTALGERLDPEAVREIQAAYYRAARAALERHGGMVEKYIGDAVLGIFGARLVHEDDALRASRAALDLRGEVWALSSELEQRYGTPLEVRMGIASGEALVGDPGLRQAFVSGDVVNVAARLEQAARPGDILISEATFRLVGSALTTEPLGPLQVRGRDTPVPAHRLLGARADTAAEASVTAMVARASELGALREAWFSVLAALRCRVFTLIGDAGIGKSRLIEALVTGVGGTATVASGRCVAYGEGATYWPLRQVVRSLAGVDRDEPAAIEAALRRQLASAVDAARAASVLGALITAASKQPRTNEISWATRQLLRGAAQARPVLLVFDDLQWAEPTLLHLIRDCEELSEAAPILIIGVARPELADAHPNWRIDLSLDPLDGPSARALIEDLLGGNIDDEAADQVLDAAGGNPLFLLELTRFLRDRGDLVQDNGRWQGRIHGFPVPDRVTAILQALLDALPVAEREIVDAAAVEGERFHQAWLTAARPDLDVSGGLELLSSHRFVRRAPAELPAGPAFTFTHILVRDAAYEALPKRRRAELHERYAGWLESAVTGQRHEAIVGQHLVSARQALLDLGEPGRAGTVGRMAGERLAVAGRRAFESGDMPAATVLLRRATDLLGEHAPERIDLLPELGKALAESGDLADARQTLLSAVEWSDPVSPVRARADIYLGLLRVWTDPEADLSKMRREAQEAVEVLRETGDARSVALGLSLLAEIWFGLGDLREGDARLLDAARAARQAGDRWMEAECLAVYGSSFSEPTTPSAARARWVLEQLPGNQVVAARALPSLGMAEAFRGDVEAGREHAHQGLKACERLGLRIWFGEMSLYAAVIERIGGDLEREEETLRKGLAALESIGDTFHVASLEADLARNLERRDRLEEAAALLPSDGVSGQSVTAIWKRAVWTRLAARRAGGSAVRDAVGEVLDDLAHLGDWGPLGTLLLLDLAYAYRLAGGAVRAAELVRQAREKFRDQGVDRQVLEQLVSTAS